jgi:hypothetical protein
MTTYAKHPTTGKEIGQWQRCQGQRYWEGPCLCGSGKEGHEVFDHNGIPFGISCSVCNRKPAHYEPWEENIEDDY